MIRPNRRIAIAALLALAALFAAPAPALADEAGEPLGLMPSVSKLYGASGAEGEETSSLFPSLLSTDTTPESISVGIACKMTDMCGIDPCTCGKPDAWGACACAGFEDTAPTVTVVSSDPSVVEPVEAFGRTWLVPHGAGEADVTVSASLVHYQDATTTIHVKTLPFDALDAFFLLAAIVILAGCVALVVVLVRLVARGVKRLSLVARERRSLKADLKARNPLTWRDRYRAQVRPGAAEKRRVAPVLHDFARALSQAAPVAACGLVVFCALVPVSTTCIADISVSNVDYTHEQIKYQLFAPDLAPVVSAAATVFGVVLAIRLFRFLLDKRATTAWFSVGVPRAALFGVRFCAGALSILAAIGLPFAVSFVANACNLGVYDGFVHEALYVAFGYMASALVAFSLAALVTACAGTLFEAVLFSAALVLGPTVVAWGLGVLARYLLVGQAAGVAFYGQDSPVAPSYVTASVRFNPALFFLDEGATHQSFTALHPVYYPEPGAFSYLAVWLLAALALAALALALFVRRPGEQAEMAGMNPVLSILSVAVCGLAAFAACVSVLGPVDVAVALVAAACVFALVSCAFLFGPLRGKTARRTTLACVGGELAAMGVAVAVLATGAFGFSTYVPAAADVASVEVSYAGSPTFIAGAFSGTSSTGTYYYTATRTYTSASAIDLVRAVHAELVDTQSAARATNYMDFASTVVPYDVEIAYTLADGSTAVRYYPQATVSELGDLLSLDDAPEARALETALVTQDVSTLSDTASAALAQSPSYAAFSAGSVYLADGALNRILALDLDEAEKIELRAALAQDLAAQSAAERYAPATAAKAVLMFTRTPELDVASFGYSFSNAVLYLDDSFTDTLAWLDEKGILSQIDTELDPAIFESLTFQLDDPYASINKVTSPVSRYFMGYRTETSGSFWVTQDYGALKTVTDSASIAATLPSLRLGCFMSGGYLVEGKLRGIDAYVYFYLPAELAPDFL
jgi:ABC-2 type transport system permease protein